MTSPRIAITGSSGRIGRAIFAAVVRAGYSPVGIDRSPASVTHHVGDIRDPAFVTSALVGCKAVIHTAALHAPHVGIASEAEFVTINEDATRIIFDAALAAGASRFVFTSTTALYGEAIQPHQCRWIDEDTPPVPRTIYHTTKLPAECWLEQQQGRGMPIYVLRMSRCFPEPADRAAAYRLHRGIDARDVADGHVRALTHQGRTFQRFILSGASPFLPEDCPMLAHDAASILRLRAPADHAFLEARGWSFPASIDRVYSPAKAQALLGWTPRYGCAEVACQLDRGSLEVLPAGTVMAEKAE